MKRGEPAGHPVLTEHSTPDAPSIRQGRVQHAARLQDAAHFPQELVRVRDVLHDLHHVDYVELVIGKGDVIEPLDSRDVESGCLICIDHRRRDLGPRGGHAARPKVREIGSYAATVVEHPLPLSGRHEITGIHVAGELVVELADQVLQRAG